MSKFIKYDSSLTDVLTGGTFDHRELSGRPEFTGDSSIFSGTAGENTFNTGTIYGGATNALSGQITFEGYNFDSLQGVMLSTIGTADLFQFQQIGVGSSETTALPYLSGGATITPALSGYFLTAGTSAGTYALNNYNSMSVAFPELTATGIIDVVPINEAGYTTLAKDINTTITIN